MSTFTQDQLKQFERVAKAAIKSTTPLIGKYMGQEKGKALFGFRFDVPPRHKCGLPIFVLVDADANCQVIDDLDEILHYRRTLLNLPDLANF